MVAKLKSALDPIHWSLLLKAVLVAGGWYWLPMTWALILALIVFLVPPYRSGIFSPAFLVLLASLFTIEPTFFFAVLMGVGFYCLLGVKNLVLIHRATAYQILVTVLFLFVWWMFFDAAQGGYSLEIFAQLLLVAALFFFFSWRSVVLGEMQKGGGHYKLLLGVLSLLVFEWGLVVYFLPMALTSKVALALLVTGFLLELILQYIKGSLIRRDVLIYLGVFFLLFVAVLILVPR